MNTDQQRAGRKLLDLGFDLSDVRVTPPAKTAVGTSPIPVFTDQRMFAPKVAAVRRGRLDAFHYFEEHGKAHITELMKRKMSELSLDTGSPFAAWEGGDSRRFTEAFSYQLFIEPLATPWDLAERTLAPIDLWKLIDGVRLGGESDPSRANDYQPAVTRALEDAYRKRLHEALARLMPRLIQEWNRRTLADQDERAEGAASLPPERPEANQPGLEIMQSHPIDRYVLIALWGHATPVLVPDFAAFRAAFPSEAVARGSRDAEPPALRAIRFAWRAPLRARRWIEVTGPLDATPEEVAHELFGDTALAYLVTSVGTRFGFDVKKHRFVRHHEEAFRTFQTAPRPPTPRR
ncbi:MAG TPA: hypothetical protein VFK02_31025 [Kofleriaceae bacterium]|nr:hypothetical protein [Kofleriaceae bacterium]